MVFESVMAISSALGAINKLIAESKEAGGNVRGIMDKMMLIQDGMQKFEIDRQASLVAPLTPIEAQKLAFQKSSIRRYNEELQLICSMNREASNWYSEYEKALSESREQHKKAVRDVMQKRARRKKMLYNTMATIGLILIAGLVGTMIVSMVILAYR